ncbi:MAG TPA: tripartite tricarboxylate transporter substrate-binding protein [Burkholderiales bacterium]
MKRILAALLAAPCLALAQGYPSKPARIIVPFPPGGTTDLIARIVQPKFQEFLGAQILIENKGGAGGSIGAGEAARSAPDGYTMLMVFDTHAVNHHLYKDAPDPFKSLEHLMLMVTSPSSLVAGTAFAPSNLKDVVAAAKAAPEKVSYGSVGSGSSNHLGALLLEQVAGVKMLHVPYKGGGPLVQAMLGNQVNVAFISTPLILPHIKSGKVKAIAVGGKQRMAVLPEVATLSETFPGFEQVSWFGLLVPAGTPKEVSAKIHGAMARTLAVPEVRQKLVDGGFEMVASSPEEFLRFVRAESDKLGKLIRDNGIKVE